MRINNLNHNYQNRINNTNFNGCVVKKEKVGQLSWKTFKQLDILLRTYDEIISKLNCKTKLGLAILQEKYPQITIGDSLIFHNCGEDKSSISIIRGLSHKNKDLVYIAKRKGHSEESKRILIDSFMLNEDRILKNSSGNYVNCFITDRIPYTQNEIDEFKLEENLSKIIVDLDSALFLFRKFLNKNMDDNLKLPDGKIPDDIQINIEECFEKIERIKLLREELPKKRALDAMGDFQGLVKNSGSSNIIFENLGEKELKISFFNIDSKFGENLKRLTIYDKNDNIINAYLIANDNSIVSNYNPKHPTVIPENIILANNKEIETYIPDFKKYINLYLDKLKEYEIYMNQVVENYNKFEEIGNLKPEIQAQFSDTIKLLYSLFEKSKQFPREVVEKAKFKTGCISPISIGKGIEFYDSQNQLTIKLLPVSNKKHENLIRLTILDNSKPENNKLFLIDNFTHIVKNYNPKYPNIIPPEFKYVSKDDIEEYDFTQYLDFLIQRMTNLSNNLDEINKTFRKPKIARAKVEKKEPKKEKKLVSKEEFKNLSKECQNLLKQALKNIDNGLVEFSSVMNEIQKKVSKFYLENSK